MQWTEAAELLCSAVEANVGMTEDGRQEVADWCEGRQVKLATGDGEKHLEILADRVRDADDLADVVKRRRPDGLFDAHAARGYIALLDSATPICSPDGEPPQ